MKAGLGILCAWLLTGPPWGQLPSGNQSADPTLEEFLQKSATYEEQLENHMTVLDRETARLRRDLEIHRDAYRKGLISRRQLEEAEDSLAEAERTREAQRQALVTVRQTVAEVSAAFRPESTEETGPIQFAGTRPWRLDHVDDLEGFFRRRFGRELPVSAYGQTETHLRLGFNHHGRVDLAVHPQSPEGRALITLLRELGLPFTAFGGPRTGAATGAHIHLGPPSPRLF